MSDDPASRDGLRWEIRSSLVKRLGIPWEGMGEMANQQRDEAAMQISTMMDEIEAWRNSARTADRDIAQLRAERDAAIRERDEARRERDDARRWICRFDADSRSEDARRCGMSDHFYTPTQIAQERGWDCFKEKP